MTEAVSLVHPLAFSPDEVFQHFVDPELLVRWFYPEGCKPERAILEPRIGGLFAVDMKTVDDLALSVRGEVLELSFNSRLRFTWKWTSGPLVSVPESVVDLEFKATKSGTTLLIKQGFFSSEELMQEHARGWEMALKRLEGFGAKDGLRKSNQEREHEG